MSRASERQGRIPPLSIGAVVGGSGRNETRWGNAAMELSRRLRSIPAPDRPDVGGVKVNVVYHISGDIVRTEFAGIRTGSFNKQDMLLIVQAAVPTHDNEGAEDRVLVDLLVEAVAVAEPYLRKRGIADNLAEQRDQAMRLRSLVLADDSKD